MKTFKHYTEEELHAPLGVMLRRVRGSIREDNDWFRFRIVKETHSTVNLLGEEKSLDLYLIDQTVLGLPVLSWMLGYGIVSWHRDISIQTYRDGYFGYRTYEDALERVKKLSKEKIITHKKSSFIVSTHP